MGAAWVGYASKTFHGQGLKVHLLWKNPEPKIMTKTRCPWLRPFAPYEQSVTSNPTLKENSSS